MSDRDDFPAEGDPSTSRFHIPQANRDLQSNWELDLAKNLEEYLLKICSGEISSHQENAQSSINFAEAALLLQGSVQVYSRKVEYLYSLVLAALEFLLQKRQDQQEKPSGEPDGSEPSSTNKVVDDDNDVFLGLDDVPVEPKNCLDCRHDKEDSSSQFVKPPANLLVLEGDCLDSSGDAGELESYLLATCNFYRDFLLLDPCDAGAVDSFLTSNGISQEQSALRKGSSLRCKNRQVNFASPIRKSVGTALKTNIERNQDVTIDELPETNCAFENYNDNLWSEPHVDHTLHEEPDFGGLNDGDDSDSDDEDPWKPLNPHEPGNLKIKPFKRSKPFERQVTRNTRQNTLSSQFPIAKVDSIISPELAESFKVQLHLQESQNASQSPSYFEKLRRSFTNGEEPFHPFGGAEDEGDDNEGANDLPDSQPEFDLPNNTYDIGVELSPRHGKKTDDTINFDGAEAFPEDDLGSQASLEDLCRSHLDALLANIAETEKQTELASRVSTWKQRIEQNLDEQDTHPPFDIHQYGERIMGKLSSEADSGGSMPFTDVVRGQPKHDVARTFSALLQLVNNGDVDLQKEPPSSGLICYTASNPFGVKLLRAGRRKELEICSQRKRMKSPSRNQRSSKDNPSTSGPTSPPKSSQRNGKLPVKSIKGSAIRCTPEGKRRRKSRLTEAVDLRPAG